MTIQALSGTGALRVAGDFLERYYSPSKQIFVPTPTWANHIPIFTDAGLKVEYYRYYDKAANGLDWKGLIADVDKAPNKYSLLTLRVYLLDPHSIMSIQIDLRASRLCP